MSIEWAVLDRTLQYAIEMEEKTRPKDYNPQPTPKPRPIPEDVKKLIEDKS